MKVITLDGLRGHNGLSGALESQLDVLNVQIARVEDTIARTIEANRAGTLTLSSADEISQAGSRLRTQGSELYEHLQANPTVVSTTWPAAYAAYKTAVDQYVSGAARTIGAQGGLTGVRLGLAIAGSLAAVTVVGLALVYRSSIRRWAKRRMKKRSRRRR